MKKYHGWDVSENDIQNYVNACNLILQNDEIFSNFKSSEEYNVILEHVDQNLGNQYYEHVQQVGKEIYDENLEKFLENDSIGNPKKFLYGGKNISPTTLRYIKNVLDLSSLCGDEELTRIVEVGGGYGGLCKTLSVLCEFDEYINIDLPEVVEVQRKYLKNFSEIYSKIKFTPCNLIENITDVDLFISNYSLSELTVETQLKYYDKIIKNSKIVYITYNSITNSDKNYNVLTEKMKDDGFKFDNKYRDYGHHQNVIISAKK